MNTNSNINININININKNTKVRKITTPISNEVISSLKAGDSILLSGVVYTARDAAHKRIAALIKNNEKMPFDPHGQIIYYVGPCPAKEGDIVGSAGPTTSGRMDIYTPELLSMGIKGMIGKGMRNADVVNAMIKYKAIYFAAIGGAGALAAERIISQRVVAFEDLGTEAIHEMVLEDMPLYVAIDATGLNIYDYGKLKYKGMA